MDRRGFLTSTGAAAAFAATARTSAAADANSSTASTPDNIAHRKFPLALAWPKTVAGPADMAHRLALRIQEATGGRIRFEILGGEPSDARLSASAPFQYGSEHDHHARHPYLAYFAGLPANAGLGATDLEAWIAYGGGQDLWDQTASSLGFKPLLAGHLGENPILWSNVEITSLERLRRLRVAATSASSSLLRALGAEVVDCPPAELSDAFSSGKLDAVEHGSTLNAMGSGIAQTARYAYTPGLSAAGSAVALRIELETWKSLVEADRAILTACAREAYQSTLTEARLSEAVLLKTLQQRHGLSVQTMPTDISSALPNLAQAIVADIASRDEFSKTINASYMAFRHQLENSPPSGPQEAMMS